MEREKGVVLEEISMCEDDNSDVVLDMLAEGYFGNNPLGRTILGERENVKNFSRNDLIEYIGNNYCAESSVVSIVGHIEFDKAKELVEKYFEGKFSSNCKRSWHDIRHSTQRSVFHKYNDIEQSNIALDFPAFEYDDKLTISD